MRVLVHWRVLMATGIAILLATPLAPVDLPGLLGVSPVEFVALGIPMMVGSIFAHELGHALAAHALGLGARSVFLDIFQGHTVPARAATRARDDVVVYLAGPLVNLVIWFVLGRLAGDMYAPLFTTGSAMAITASFNLLLLTNFLPVLPMDGGRALAAVLWGATGDRVRGTQVAGVIGHMVVAVVVLGAAGWIGFVREDPVWGAVIAGSLLFQFRGMLGQAFDGHDRIAALRVEDVMCPGLRTAPDALARSIVNDRVSRKHSPDLGRLDTVDLPYVVITDEGELVGMLSPGEVEWLALEHLRWDEVRVADVMTPRGKLVTVAPETELHTAVVYMVERQLEALLVVEGGEPVGCVTWRRLMRAMEDAGDEGGRWTAERTGSSVLEAPSAGEIDEAA
jgi:Zn-dependent protease